MNIQLKSFKELIGMTNDQRQVELAPRRISTARAKASLLIAETEEKIAAVEQRIQEACTGKEIDFNRLADMIDEMELLTLRKSRFSEISAQLFPVEA